VTLRYGTRGKVNSVEQQTLPDLETLGSGRWPTT